MLNQVTTWENSCACHKFCAVFMGFYYQIRSRR